MFEAIVVILTGLVAVATALPFLPVAHGFVRVWDFPRVQIAVIAALLLALVVAFEGATTLGVWLGGVLLFATAVQLGFILRFTPVWRVQSVRAKDGVAHVGNTFSVLASNVKMSNRAYHRAVALVRGVKPDIAVFMETDRAWYESLREIEDEYPNVVNQAQDNAYGMVLFSKLPLDDVQVRYLLTDGVPSISAAVTLRDGRRFRLYALHPEPPVPFAESLGRDAELVLIAKLVTKDNLPSVVTGDLNDVAWSRTTHRFQRLSRMLDPRVGRGFYNSFDARFFFLRWPLDHLFHEQEFRLVHMKRLQDIGSDHFPMYFVLALAGAPNADAEPDQPDATDKEEASELIEEAVATRNEREPIGTDWER